MSGLTYELQASAYRRLIEIGIALSADKNLDSLLEHILLEAKSMANADAGTIYLCTSNDSLKFRIMLIDSLNIAQGGLSGKPVTFPEIPLLCENAEPNLSNIATKVVHCGSTVVVDEVMGSSQFDFDATRAFDEMLSYRSRSFLTIPLKGMADNCLGVLQLINAQDDQGDFVPFSRDIIPLIEALASQASVAMENRSLLDQQETLKKQREHEVDQRTEELKDALTRLSEAHIVLKELNTIDAVTGIRNRHYFDEALGQEWRRAKRQGYDISLLLLDIDHFKKVNDTYGHLAGDECLAAVAKEVDDMFNRPSDVVARYGGEEFAVILPYVSGDNAMGLAEQVREILAQKTFIADGHEIQVTVSIGVATIPPGNDTAPRDLIGWADRVLYEAKASGRNRVCRHTIT